MKKLLTANVVLLAILIGFVAVSTGRRPEKESPAVEQVQEVKRFVYAENGRDLYVEDLQALRKHYKLDDIPKGHGHEDDFRNMRGWAYEIFEPINDQLIDGDLFIFETEFGTSFATTYDIKMLKWKVESRLQQKEDDKSGGRAGDRLFPE